MNDSQRGVGFSIGPAMHVALEYQVFDAEGERLSSDSETLAFVFGFGEVLPRIEQALDGRVEHDAVVVELQARDAYGERDPSNVLEVDRSEFPEEVCEGDHFEVQHERGGLLVLSVLGVGPEAVLVDLNHPLAGQTVRFELAVRTVRPASAQEIELAESKLAKQVEPVQSLLSPEQLLRGKSSR